jgi:hypothetical protein
MIHGLVIPSWHPSPKKPSPNHNYKHKVSDCCLNVKVMTQMFMSFALPFILSLMSFALPFILSLMSFALPWFSPLCHSPLVLNTIWRFYMHYPLPITISTPRVFFLFLCIWTHLLLYLRPRKACSSSSCKPPLIFGPLPLETTTLNLSTDDHHLSYIKKIPEENIGFHPKVLSLYNY